MKLIFLALVLIWFITHITIRSQALREPFIISHRGAAGYSPENTLVGINKAHQCGAEFTEIDVHRTADGVLVIMHDTTVDRTTNGTGAIRNLSWKDISKLDAGRYFSEDYSPEPVPKLEDVLKLAAELNIKLILEVKKPDLYPDIDYQIVDHIEEFYTRDNVTIVSFDHDWLDRFGAFYPAIPRGKLYWWIGAFDEVKGLSFVDVYWLSVLIDPTMIRRAHNKGVPIVVWTVNDQRLMKLLYWMGVDGITTDKPDLFRNTLNRK
jgi:glycerophosphoryl diester phosphodiesterase